MFKKTRIQKIRELEKQLSRPEGVFGIELGVKMNESNYWYDLKHY